MAVAVNLHMTENEIVGVNPGSGVGPSIVGGVIPAFEMLVLRPMSELPSMAKDADIMDAVLAAVGVNENVSSTAGDTKIGMCMVRRRPRL